MIQKTAPKQNTSLLHSCNILRFPLEVFAYVRVPALQGGKQQLEEVWEENDGMDKDDFDPKTFFHMHGTHPAREERDTNTIPNYILLCTFLIL